MNMCSLARLGRPVAEVVSVAPFRRRLTPGGEVGAHLDCVLRGEADESFVAAQGGCESEKGQVVAGVALVARAQTPAAGQPGHRPLDDPAAAAQSFAGLDAFARDPYSDAFAT